MQVAQVTSLSRAKQARIVDELGALKAQIAALQDQYDNKIAVFKDFGVGEYTGKVYKVTVTEASRTTLDSKLVKGFLTPAQINQCSKVAICTSAVVRAR
jgi:hypothetical protein